MHKLNSFLLLCVCAVIVTATYAQEGKRYPIGKSSNMLNDVRRQLVTGHRPDGAGRLQLRVAAAITLPATINFRSSSGTGHEQLVGSIENNPNSSFYLVIDNKSVHGHILLNNSKKAYQYSSDSTGTVFVQETDINKIVCVNYQKAEQPISPANTTTDAATANAAAAVADLQSYPGGNGCVLLDFDGQYVSGTGWNNGNPINAAPANLSDAEKQAVWQLISEDYRSFHLNVTTSEAVFNTYPKTRRMRCIFTPTNTAAPGAGGVAYVGSFTWNDDTPCWVFNSGAKGAGDAGAHEVGHTFGLSHDGRTSPAEEYYAGQGSWAPIMGVGYYVPIVQWSKGEYANANNKEDDLAKISSTTNGVGYRADDYGNTLAAAASLNVDASGKVNIAGVIERTGDVDMFSFTTIGGTVSLNFNPAAQYPDLDILATLYNSSGTAIISANPTALNAAISTTLAAGTYYVAVTGTGAGDPVTNGYSNYGSLGSYTITGSVTGGSNNPTGVAIFYKDCNYSGAYAVGLPVGNYTIAQLAAKGISNKDVSSIKITSGYEVVLYKNDNFTGASVGFTSDVACLVSNGWNDSASSIRVRSVTNQLPAISITSPAAGSSYTTPASISITANASDIDGSISKVEFFNGSTKLGETTTAPYTFSWSGMNAGSYTIKAVATDDRGGQVAAQVSVTVNNPAGAIVYKDCNYLGYAINLPVGIYTLTQLIKLGAVNDDISSVKVNSGYELILYHDDNFLGPAYLFRGNASCLVSVGLSGGTTVNLNDWTSSVVVRKSAAAAALSSDGSVATPLAKPVTTLVLTPNPAINQVVVEYGDPGTMFDVKVMDINGTTIFTAPHLISGQPLNISNLKTGIYFIKINTGSATVTKKLIKR